MSILKVFDATTPLNPMFTFNPTLSLCECWLSHFLFQILSSDWTHDLAAAGVLLRPTPWDHLSTRASSAAHRLSPDAPTRSSSTLSVAVIIKPFFVTPAPSTCSHKLAARKTSYKSTRLKRADSINSHRLHFKAQERKIHELVLAGERLHDW